MEVFWPVESTNDETLQNIIVLTAGGDCMSYKRRAGLAGLGLPGLETAISPLIRKVSASSLMRSVAAGAGTCPFRLAVINDEITQDFEKACQIVSGDFGLHWIELRSMWDKNVTAR